MMIARILSSTRINFYSSLPNTMKMIIIIILLSFKIEILDTQYTCIYIVQIYLSVDVYRSTVWVCIMYMHRLHDFQMAICYQRVANTEKRALMSCVFQRFGKNMIVFPSLFPIRLSASPKPVVNIFAFFFFYCRTKVRNSFYETIVFYVQRMVCAGWSS